MLVEFRLGGCFATSTFVWTDALPSGFALVVPCLSVNALPPLLVWADALPPWFFFTLADALPLGISVLRRRLCNHSVLRFFFAGSSVAMMWVPLVCGLSALFSPCCLLLYVLSLCLVCVCFFSVSLFSFLLCSCVGQTRFGRIKIMSVIAFFLIKNVFKHGCEKN